VAEQTVHFEVALKALAIRKPEVTDDLAKSVGGWDTVDRRCAAIGADIRKHREALQALEIGTGSGAHEPEVPAVREELQSR
jgi:hypothetical protein